MEVVLVVVALMLLESLLSAVRTLCLRLWRRWTIAAQTRKDEGGRMKDQIQKDLPRAATAEDPQSGPDRLCGEIHCRGEHYVFFWRLGDEERLAEHVGRNIGVQKLCVECGLRFLVAVAAEQHMPQARLDGLLQWFSRGSAGRVRVEKA